MRAQSIQETLQSEFSPPLDTSLIAAIVADYINETTVGPPHTQIQALRQILAELAAQAEAEQDDDHISDDFARLQLSSTDDNTSMTDFFAGSSTNTAATSTVSSISQQSFSSPLGFLQAAFPHLPVSRLKSALGSAQDEDEVDMESVVNDIMSSEVVRELEERGLEEEKGPEAEWELTQSTKKKKRKAGKTFTLVDVRQRQHIQTPTTSRPSTHDAWTQLSSVTSHLETLLPTQSASYFLSFFHSPIYRSPSDALRASFLSMSASCSSESKPEETHTLFLMFDVIRESPDYVSLPDVDRERMMDDAQLALHATQGNADAAIDIVWLLRELDAGDIDAIYHSPVPTSPISPNGVNMKSKHASRLPAGPPTVQPPRLKARVVNTPVIPKPPPNAWKTVPAMPKRGPNPHAEFIPAYKPNKTPATSNGKKKGNAHRGRASELEQQRREALRQASRAWQRGNSHSRGGEVALYFAERARELQEEARKENLHAAWDMVDAKRVTTQNSSSIDLHGTTVAEAIQIAKDVLRDDPPTPARPLKIITGRGKHSTNGVGVLGPAVCHALAEAGWNVAKFDGGLTVRGRSARML